MQAVDMEDNPVAKADEGGETTAQQSPPAENALRSSMRDLAYETFSHFLESPCNWHQATIYYLAYPEPEDGPRMRLTLAAGSVLIVFLQLWTVAALVGGIEEPTCFINRHCDTGFFCRPLITTFSRRLGSSQLSDRGLCSACGGFGDYGDDAPVDAGIGTDQAPLLFLRDASFLGLNQSGRAGIAEFCNNAAEPGHSDEETWCGYSLSDIPEASRDWRTDASYTSCRSAASWCDSCLHPTTKIVDVTTVISRTIENVRAMSAGEYVVLILATSVIAMGAVGELRDIYLCDISLERADPQPEIFWMCVVSVIKWGRRWMFLPSLVVSVAQLVVLQGGNAVNM